MKISVFCLCLSIAAAAASSAGCKSKDSPTAPTTVAPTEVAAPPEFGEEFKGVVPVEGSTFYSFTVTKFGTVNLKLSAVGGAFVPKTVTLGFGIGVPSGEGCAATTSVATTAASTPQLTGNYPAGIYCAVVHDLGNLFAPANVTVYIEFP